MPKYIRKQAQPPVPGAPPPRPPAGGPVPGPGMAADGSPIPGGTPPGASNRPGMGPGGPPAPGGPGVPPGGPGGQPRPGLNPHSINPDPTHPPDLMKPRTPPGGPGGPMPGSPGGPGEVPTDVHVDAATGHVNISKGPVTIRIAKYDPDNPPSKVKHLPAKAQRQWVHVYNSAVDDGADEESAHKQAWGTVPDKGKKTKDSSVKEADVSDRTGSPWDEFNAGNAPEIDDTKDELFYDTHDNPYATSKNRRVPATVDIVAKVPEGQNPRALAFAFQMYTTSEAEVDGQTVTIKGVQHPLGTLNELAAQGIDASVKNQGDLARIFKGEKVAMIGDFPEMNYYPNDQTRKVEAMVIGKEGDHFLLRNDMWGVFKAEVHEFEQLF